MDITVGQHHCRGTKAVAPLLALALLLAGPVAAQQAPPDPMIERMLAGGPVLDAADLDARLAAAAAKPLGSRDNPVRAAGPAGQHAYLRRLRCADGRAPAFRRQGSFGPGPFASIIDGYRVDCGGAAPAEAMVFMDLYHPGHVEAGAVPGFAITP